MAGSRLDRIGTIFSRATGLIKSGGVKYEDRPLWYDIYRVFPPKYEPWVERQAIKGVEEVSQIFYKEDRIRAKFFQRFGPNPEGKVRRLTDPSHSDPSSTFLEKWQETGEKHPDWEEEKVFETCAEEYLQNRVRKDPPKPEEFLGYQEGSASSAFFKEVGSEEEDAKKKTRRPSRVPLVTVESLRSLFEEAKRSSESSHQDVKGEGDGEKKGSS